MSHRQDPYLLASYSSLSDTAFSRFSLSSLLNDKAVSKRHSGRHLPVELCGRTNLIGKDKLAPQKASPTTDRKYSHRREDNNSKKEEKLCREGR